MKRNALILAALFLICTALPAFAHDGKVYPGSMGVRWNSSEPVPSLNCSALVNPSSTQTLHVDLPIIHDVIDLRLNSGWVKVVDQHYSEPVRCSLCGVCRTGTSFTGFWSSPVTSDGSSSNTQTLSFDVVLLATENPEFHYYYSCSIPPSYNGNKSSIISYMVVEN